MAKSKELELTVIHVTNEEQEAMMVADRIAVINQGKIVQVGTPHEIYYHPKNLFVANFMSEINYFDGICMKEEKPSWDIYSKSLQSDKFFNQIQEDSVPFPLDIGVKETFAGYVQKEVVNEIQHKNRILLVVRANHMKIRLGNRIDEKRNAISGTILRSKFMGVFYRFEVLIKINDQEKVIIVTRPATYEIHENFKEDSEVTVYFPKELGIVFKHPGEEIIKEVLKLE
jgi:ABC-type Fe3+/spermidine/putrescine transport system ATPase subunit